MERSDEGGIVLTDLERSALALLLVARMTRPDTLGSVEWEDVPELAEREWCRLEKVIAEVGEALMRQADLCGVDSRYVYGEVC